MSFLGSSSPPPGLLMGDVRDPNRDQVLPTPNDGPSCHDLVILDLEERKAFGLKKYDSLLQPNNGRSMLQDAYEEVLDLAAYLRGALEEARLNDHIIKEDSE